MSSVQAQTGTGKTAAFGLPTLEKIDVDNTVIKPLSLPQRVSWRFKSQEELFLDAMGYQVRSVYGGSSIEKQNQKPWSRAHRCEHLDIVDRWEPWNSIILSLDPGWKQIKMLNMGFLEYRSHH